MKYFYTIFFSGLLLNTFAQKENEVDFTNLTSPSIPAFTILGVQPSEISRPKTLDALETSLYSNFSKDGNITLPKNYALEFTPYWIKPKRKLTFTEYINPTPGQSMAQNSAFSLASYEQKSYADTTKNNVRMGIGYRTVIDWSKFNEDDNYVKARIKLYKGLFSISQISAVLLELENADNIDTMSANSFINQFNKRITEIKTEGTEAEQKDLESMVKVIVTDATNNNKSLKGKDLIKKIEEVLEGKAGDKAETKKQIEKMAEVINDRYGFRLEMAAAITLDFPTNDVYYSKVPKFGIWFTPSYRLSGKKVNWAHNFEFLGVVRYIKNYLPNNYSDNIDLGAKIVFETGKFSINGELIQRFQTVTISSETVNNITTKTTESTKDFKATLNLNYALTQNIVLTYSFGKNYELNTGNADNLISMLSLNYALGKMNKNNFKDTE
ncbi:MAG: hypothetical protein JNL24_06980 [Bacteroidia bacterium]|nr:hypothetical protein [Bacteroidia bacterium]